MEFDVLKDLVRVITRNKIKQIEVLGNPGNDPGHRLARLYDLLARGEVEREEEVVRHFYGTDDPRLPAYRKLRRRLVRQLTNTAFFVDANLPQFDERSKAQYNCYRDFAAAFILISRDARRAGVYLLRQTLEQVEKYELVELAADITRHLRNAYSRSVSDVRNHQKFSLLNRRYEAKRRLLLDVADAYEILLEHYMASHAPSEVVHTLAAGFVGRFKPLREEAGMAHFDYYVYVMETMMYSTANDQENVIRVVDEALAHLHGNPNVSKGKRLVIAIQKMSALTQLKRSSREEIRAAADVCLSHCEYGAFNWLLTRHAEVYCFLHHGLFDDALAAYTELALHPRLVLQPERFREECRLLGAYLHLLALAGVLPPDAVEQVAGPYRPARFENDFVVLARDKEGMNIPILLLPELFSLLQGDYTAFDEHLNKLEKYRRRYLETPLNQRSNHFVLLLMALHKKHYEKRSRAGARIRRELAALEALTPQVSRQNFAVEIVPYELLWQLLAVSIDE